MRLRIWSSLKTWFQARGAQPRLDAEMDEEMRLHLDLQTQENLESGMSAEEARYAARRQFGWVESIQETCRDQRDGPLTRFLTDLLQDARFGGRMLGKHPGSTLLAVFILALGLGGNTAIYSVVDKALLHPLPCREPDRLLALREVDIRLDARWGVSPPLIAELSTYTNEFASMTAFEQFETKLKLAREATTNELKGCKVSANFFSLLGINPVAGRAFLPEEGKPGADNVLVASYGLWQQQFGGDPAFIGRTLNVEDRVYTVIGIMPASFQFPFSPGNNQFWLPQSFTPEQLADREYIRARHWDVIVRMQAGTALPQVQALLDTVAQRRQQEYPDPHHQWIIEAKPARSLISSGRLEQTLWSLQLSMVALLLIACANVATLMLSRAIARRGEFGVRLAIGAGRYRLVRQLLIESAMLALLAGLAGVCVAWSGIRLLQYFYLGNLPHLKTVGLDGWVMALTVLASTVTGLGFGLAPAWFVSGLRLSESLKDATPQQTGGGLARFIQDGLLVAQVSLAVVLLTGAGMLIQSMARLVRVNPGLDSRGLYRLAYDANPMLQMSRVDPADLAKQGWTRKQWFQHYIRRLQQWDDEMVARLRAVPGISSAAINGSSGGCYAEGVYLVEGREDAIKLCPSTVGVRSGDYFQTLRLPLVQGRLFTPADGRPGEQTVVVNQELARRCWPGQNPVGKHIISTNSNFREDFWVVGVVTDMRDWRRDEPQRPTLYIPVERNTEYSGIPGDFMFRSQLEPEAVRTIVTKLGAEMSPSTKISFFYSVESQLRASTTDRRVYLWLLNTLAALGLLLSALGVYAVVAYGVARRTREIGVRMALGAGRGDILRLVAGRGCRLVLNGMVLGIAGAAALAFSMESLLYEVKPSDPWIYACVLLALGLTALLAGYLPARRAVRIDPTTALRTE